MDVVAIAITVGTTLFAGGAAWGGAKAALNGTKRRVERIESEQARQGLMMDKHLVDDAMVQTSTVDKLARIETKIDILMGERRGPAPLDR